MPFNRYDAMRSVRQRTQPTESRTEPIDQGRWLAAMTRSSGPSAQQHGSHAPSPALRVFA